MWQRRTLSTPLVRHVQVHMYRNLTYFTDYAWACVATLPRAHCCLLRLWLPIKVGRVIIFGKTIQTYCTVKNSFKNRRIFQGLRKICIVFWIRSMDFLSIMLIWNLGSLVIAIDGIAIHDQKVKLINYFSITRRSSNLKLCRSILK